MICSQTLSLCLILATFAAIFAANTNSEKPKRSCKPKIRAAPNWSGNDIDSNAFEDKVLRKPIQKVYFWPSLNEFEKSVLRDSFFQIARRTCVQFLEQEYKPWYHADRWDNTSPHVLIRKSGQFAAYSDATVEGIVDRTILYIAQSSFIPENFNHSRGIVIDQLVRFMGLKRELYRPDAVSYVQAIATFEPSYSSHGVQVVLFDTSAARMSYTQFFFIVRDVPLISQPDFNPIQLQWPFDPESVTVSLWAREKYRLTQYCPARNDADIGAGQRVGLLTRWDSVKLNSMYCPDRVATVDPSRGPCVVPRAKDLDDFRRRLWAYRRLLAKNN